MPLYEYLCEKCQKVSEVMQKFTDQPLQECPQDGCGGKVAKLVSRSSFALKGSGWYTTDYKAKPKTDATVPKPETKPEAKPEAKTDPKPDPKPAKKSD